MSQLFFKKRFQDAIRANQKTTTIRRWAKPLLQAGQQAFCPGLGWLAIEAVDVIQLEDLGDDDANSDGFSTAAEMRRLLQELYPAHATDRKLWFRVRFRLNKLHERPNAPAENAPSLF
jgi:hypothetical protein